MRSNIGIFGGTFNPPHNGHLHLARIMFSELQLDKLIIIPGFQPPHKGNINVSAEDRFNMCRLAFDCPNFEVSDIEIKRGGKSYTIDTVTQLKELYPDDNLFLIMSSDMLKIFNKWYRYKDILKLCTVCSSFRYDEPKIKPDFFLEEDRVYLSSAEPLILSSTQIRENVRNNIDVSDLVPKKVNEYINEKGFYRD